MSYGSRGKKIIQLLKAKDRENCNTETYDTKIINDSNNIILNSVVPLSSCFNIQSIDLTKNADIMIMDVDNDFNQMLPITPLESESIDELLASPNQALNVIKESDIFGEQEPQIIDVTDFPDGTPENQVSKFDKLEPETIERMEEDAGEDENLVETTVGHTSESALNSQHDLLENTDSIIEVHRENLDIMNINDKDGDGSEEDKQEDLRVKTRNKRRLMNKNEWRDNSNRIKRERGKQYCGKIKQDQQWGYEVKKNAKKIKGRCSCDGTRTMKCSQISNQDREQIFETFWNLSWPEKKLYITTLVEQTTTKRNRNRKNEQESRREFSCIYYLKIKEKIRVCKTMFCNTFGIPPRTMGHWIMHSDVHRAKTTKNNKADENKMTVGRNARWNEQKECLKDFFNSLPILESHYCRKSSSKLYLEPNWTSKSSLYNLYKDDWCKERSVLSLSYPVFSNTFDDLNLSLFTPKKDQCDVCVSHDAKNIDEVTYQNHLIRKNEARVEKENDKLGENKIVFTMDLQSVLLSPKSNVSSLYYKTKLIVHNFTLFNIKTKAGYCYLWHEGEAGLTSNVFASIIYYFLITHVIRSTEMEESITL